MSVHIALANRRTPEGDLADGLARHHRYLAGSQHLHAVIGEVPRRSSGGRRGRSSCAPTHLPRPSGDDLVAHREARKERTNGGAIELADDVMIVLKRADAVRQREHRGAVVIVELVRNIPACGASALASKGPVGRCSRRPWACFSRSTLGREHKTLLSPSRPVIRSGNDIALTWIWRLCRTPIEEKY